MTSERNSKLIKGQTDRDPTFKIAPEDIDGLDNSSKAMVFASYLMAKDPDLSSEKAVILATNLLISTDLNLKKIYEDARRRKNAMIAGFSFSALCLIAVLVSVYLGLPAAVSIALIGVMTLSIGMSFIIVASKVTQKGFSGMVDSVKSKNRTSEEEDDDDIEE